MHLVEPPHPPWFLGHPLPRGERVVPRGKDSNRIVEPSPLAGEGSPQPALSLAGAGRVRGSGIRCRIYETTYLLTCPFLRHPGWKRDLCFRNRTRNLLCYQQQVALSAKNLLQRDHRCYTPSLADRCRSFMRTQLILTKKSFSPSFLSAMAYRHVRRPRPQGWRTSTKHC